MEQTGGGYDSDEEDEEDFEDEQDEEDGAEDESESESEDEAEDDNDGTVDPEFRRRVAEALQVAGVADKDSDGENENDDDDQDDDEEDSEDESDDDSVTMDDDQMLALDEKLASIFKERTAAKKGNNAGEFVLIQKSLLLGRASDIVFSIAVEALHFKQRVLDLVEVYLRKQSANPMVFSFIPILLQLSQSSSPAEKTLAEKAKAILLRRFDKNDDVPTIKDVQAARKTLEAVHNTARRASSKEVVKACSNVSVHITKAMNQSGQKGAASAATDVYRESLKDCMTRKSSKLPATFISDYIQRQPILGWALRGDILNYAKGDGVNDFHYLSALTLLSAVAKQFANLVKAGEKDSVASFVKDCRAALYETLETKGSATGKWNAPRLKEVIKSALQVARFSQVVYDTPETLAQAWSVEDLRNIQLTLGQTERLANTPSVFKMLTQLSLLVDPQAKAASNAKKDQKQADRKRKREQAMSGASATEPVERKISKAGKSVDAASAPKKKKAKKAD